MNLSIEQQLNYIWDPLAISAVQDSLYCFNQWSQKQDLPYKSAAVFITGFGQISNISKEVWFAMGHADSLAFYTNPLGPRDRWSCDDFQTVDRRALNTTLQDKP